MVLDLSSLKEAMGSFERALNVACSEDKMAELDGDQREVIRAGVIQNFKFTYELCWKFMKRWLSDSLGNTYVDGVARRELFRLAAENLLIADFNNWIKYHDARNRTVHTYNAANAEEVFEVAKIFFKDAQNFLKNLEEKK